jgi:ribosomal subunit interface protein
MLDVKFQVRNIELKDVTKEYIIERLQKFEKLIPNCENLTVTIDRISNSKIKNNLSKIDITIKMPHAFIKVESKGSNINSILDKLLSPLQKKIIRYKSQEERWVKHKEWKTIQIENTTQGEEEIQNNEVPSNYEPLIKRKYYQDDSPIHPAEAIERMELLGSQQFLFKNIENNRYAIIVKDKNSSYELIQPK